MHRTTTALVLLLLLLSGGLLAQTQGPKSEAKPPSDQGAGDPADFPRPPGLVRKSYSQSRGVQRDEEVATYHGGASGDALINSYTTSLSAAGWTQQARSDSGSGKSRVTIIDWQNPAKEAEVRFYHEVAGGGTDLWIRIFTYKTTAKGKAATVEASPVSAKASPTSGPAAPASPAKTPSPAAAAAEAGPGTNAPVVVVPDVGGKTRSEAEALLKQNQLTVAWGPEKPQLSPNAVPTTVGAQAPGAGQRVARGSTVTLTPLVWSVTVPQVHGTYAQAEQALADSRLHAQRGPTTPTTNPTLANQVTRQDPAAGTVVHGDSTVTLTVAVLQGPVPNVVGHTYSEAQSYLGTAPGGQPRFHAQRAAADRLTKDSRQAGLVVEQNPAAGTVAADGSTVTLTVAKWDNTGPVPNVVGQTYSDAQQRLGTAPGGQPRYSAQQASIDKPNTNPQLAGKVAEQSPAAGTLAADGSTVTLTVWSLAGPVPNVVGHTYNEAQSYLGSAPGGQPRFHAQRAATDRLTKDSRQAGQVVEQNPAAGTLAASGTTVTLTVAKWDNTGPVPDVVGKVYDDARQRLGTAPGGQPRYSAQRAPADKANTNPSQSGKVAEQNPAAGTLAPDGSTVTLTLWGLAGPVPNVVGRTYSEAQSYLGSTPGGQPHFRAQRAPTYKPTTDTRLVGQVAEQSPAAGTNAADGSTVTLTLWGSVGP